MKAIAYFSNGIGNLVMMMPALQAMASMTEENKIDVVLGDWSDNRKPAVIEILEKWDKVERVILYPKDALDPRKYDLWFYSAHGSNCEVVTAFKDHISYKPIAKPAWRSSLIHEVDHYMEIAYSMGYQGPIPKVNFPLADGPILNGVKRPVVGLCNGWFRTSYWAKKEWPGFRCFSDVFRRYYGGSIVGIGGSGELDGIPLDIDFCGKLSITESAKVMSQLDVLVTTDTGNMHISDMLGIPLIALFGSTLTSKNAPRGFNSTVLMSGVDCAPCQDTKIFMSCKDNLCMKSIIVGDVMATIKEKL